MNGPYGPAFDKLRPNGLYQITFEHRTSADIALYG